jgi:hypothetical protein
VYTKGYWAYYPKAVNPKRWNHRYQVVMHTCHHKHCLSMNCMQWGTTAENVKEGWKKKKGKKKAKPNNC